MTVTRHNAAQIASLGADLVVAGSAVFAGDDLIGKARFMLRATGSASETESPTPSAPAAGIEEDVDG